MTLEDFFTLTEMKDGLTAPSRVEELVTVMRKEKDSDIVKNIGDATRQWAAVASTIAATDNKDCLDLFVQLNGLWFIDRWLKDASKFSSDTSDGLVEESLTALLRAVEKLHIGNERSVASGISITVKNLLNHKSFQVQDRAKALFDSWKQGTVDDAVHSVVESVGEFSVSLPDSEIVNPECVDVGNSVSKGNGNGEDNSAEPTGSDTLVVSSGVDCPKQKVAEDQNIQTPNEEPCFNVTCDPTKFEHRSPNLLTSSVQESTFVKAASSTGTMEGTTSDDSKLGTAEVQPEVLRPNVISNDEKPVLKLNTLPEKLSMRASFSSATGNGEVSCGNDVANAHDVMTEPTSHNNIDDVGDVRTPASVGIDDMGGTSRYGAQIPKNDGECGSDGFQDLSSTECKLGKTEHIDTSFSQIEDDETSEEDKEHSSNDDEEDEDVRNFSEISRSRIYARSPDMIDERSDMELEYGIVDALEVARQVARAVEREVVDYRERSCSSSMEKTTENGARQSGTPDSVDGKQELPAEMPPRDMPTGQIRPVEPYHEDDRLAKNTLNNMGSVLGRDKHVVETSHVTEAAQEPEVNTEKDLCDFDLNQEVDFDETEHMANPMSAPISVPASRPIAASGSSVAPLQFEGNLGWKGSAATSAFRPASPRRISNDVSLPAGGTSSSSSHRQFFLEFDLNVADGGDDKIPAMTGNENPGASALHIVESCLEACPIESERHKLDLNLTSDDSDAPPSDMKIEGRLFHNRNGHRSVSPAASSSSSMQPSARNFDLNDRPFLLNDSTSDQGFFLGKISQSSSAYGGPKPDDPVISIMGTRVEVKGKNSIPETTSLPNGKDLDTAMDAITAREGGMLGMTPTMSYTQSDFFGYNGLTTAPTMSYSSAMYGHGSGSAFPYMVDSRGAPVVPQVVGSASALAPYSHAPLWLGPMNGVVPPRPNFDLNSGFTVGGANRDSGVFRQFLMPVQSRPMEEHLRTSSQPSSSSGVGGKRNEPDGGWEPFPFNYRNQQPPW